MGRRDKDMKVQLVGSTNFRVIHKGIEIYKTKGCQSHRDVSGIPLKRALVKKTSPGYGWNDSLYDKFMKWYGKSFNSLEVVENGK